MENQSFILAMLEVSIFLFLSKLLTLKNLHNLVEPWVLTNLKHHRTLYPYLFGPKVLDNIYFEMICRDRPSYFNLRPNAETISNLIKLIERYPVDTIFLFYFTTKGFEDVFLRLYSHFGIKVHVDKEAYQLFQKISDPIIYNYGPLFTIPDSNTRFGKYCHYDEDKACLTTELTRFRSCKPECGCLTREMTGIVHAKVCVTDDAHWVAQRNQPQVIDSHLTVSSIEGKDARGNSLKVFMLPREKRPFPNAINTRHDEFINKQYILNTNKTMLLPCHIKYNFSRHSSFIEIFNLIKLFQPKQVYPFDHGVSANRKFRMSQFFGKVCSGTEFRFDKERKEYEYNYTLRQREKELEIVGEPGDPETKSTTSADSSSIGDIADCLWNKISADSSHSVQQHKTTRVLKEEQPKSELPLYGNPMLKKEIQSGWRYIDTHHQYSKTGFGVYMNTERNFTQNNNHKSLINDKNEINKEVLMAAIRANELLQKKNKKDMIEMRSMESITSDREGIADKLFGNHDNEAQIIDQDLLKINNTKKDIDCMVAGRPDNICKQVPAERIQEPNISIFSQMPYPTIQQHIKNKKRRLCDTYEKTEPNIKLESKLPIIQPSLDLHNVITKPISPTTALDLRLCSSESEVNSFLSVNIELNSSCQFEQPKLPDLSEVFHEDVHSESIQNLPKLSSPDSSFNQKSDLQKILISDMALSKHSKDSSHHLVMNSLLSASTTKKPSLKRNNNQGQVRISILNGKSVMRYS